MAKQINWFPGHMFKTKKQLIEDIKIIDLVIEVRDARIPIISENAEINQIIKNKKKLVIFNKADLSNLDILHNFTKTFDNSYLIISMHDYKAKNKIESKIDLIVQEIRENSKIHKDINIMIVGMPNVGKSSIINALTKSKKTMTGNKPGVTKQKQWVELKKGIMLMDTPGLLIPKIDNVEDGYKMILNKLIPDSVVPIDDVAVFLLKYLVAYQPKSLKNRYQIDVDNNLEIVTIYDLIGEKIGAKIKGGEIDYDKVTNTIIHDYREQKFGKITFI